MWKRLSNREKIILIGFLAGAVALPFIYFIFTPQIKAYAQVKNEVAEHRTELSQAQAAVVSLKDENARLDKVKEEIKQNGRPFASKMNDGSDIIALGLKSVFNSVEIISIEPEEVKENQHSLELPLKIVIQADYRNVQVFCRNIDKDMEFLSNLAEIRTLKIESINTASSRDAGKGTVLLPGTVKATFGLVLFSAKNPEERAHLDEIARWLTGRYNIFRSSAAIAPIPELDGHSKVSGEPGDVPAGSGRVEGTGGAKSGLKSPGRTAPANGSANPLPGQSDPEYMIRK